MMLVAVAERLAESRSSAPADELANADIAIEL
jgi:hypothetical protein